MKFLKLKLIFIILFLFVGLALALPEFSFNVKGKTITYPGIGFSKIGIPSDYGSLVKSKDLFSSVEITTEIDFASSPLSNTEKQEKLSELRNHIQSRINYAGLYGITLTAKMESDKYYLVFNLPENYSNPENYVNWLSAEGDVTFYKGLTVDSASSVDLNDYNIEGNIDIDTVLYNNEPYPTLIFNFSDSKSDLINTLLNTQDSSGESIYITMAIDNQTSFIVEPALASTSQGYKVTYTRAIPLSNTSSQQDTDYLNIVKSYFQDQTPIEYTLTPSTNTKTISPTFDISLAKLIIGFSAVLLLFTILVGIKLGVREAIYSLVFFSTITLFEINVLKFIRANLSLGFILGMILSIFMIFYFIVEILQSDKDNYIETLNKYKYLGIVVALLGMVLYKLSLEIGQMNDLFGVLIVLGGSFFLLSFANLKFLKDLHLHFKFKK